MRTLGAWLAGIWLVTLPLCTYARSHDWQDERRLWVQASWWAPEKVRPMANLGRLAHLSGDVVGAEVFYRQAIEMSRNPSRPRFERRIGCLVASHNLGLLLTQQWRISEAMEIPPCAD